MNKDGNGKNDDDDQKPRDMNNLVCVCVSETEQSKCVIQRHNELGVEIETED